MRKLGCSLLLFGLLVASTALADDDHERARAALERGEVLPLSTILARLAPVIGQDIIEAEFDREQGRWIYEITYVDGDGRLIEIEVDAADAALLKEKRKR